MRVHLVGYRESPIFQQLERSPNVTVYGIKPFIELPRLFFIFYAPVKILWLFLQLLTLLFRLPHCQLILAQNPPSLPTIPFCWLLKCFKCDRFVIDWHNLGYSLLEVHGTSKFIVNIAKYLEFKFGRLANGHITVTNALKDFLARERINAAVVYDRPSSTFHPSPDNRGHFADLLKIDPTDVWIVSSTSWTPDEKVDLLLLAADLLESQLGDVGLTIIVTGKGVGRKSFDCEVKNRQFTKISFVLTYFDDYDEYARLLGCCDLGISLHVSSSGFDLPMKGLDMIGSGLPVLSVRYPCIGELVQEGINGRLFDDETELADLLKKMLVKKEIDLAELRKGSVKASEMRWEEEWETSARAVLLPAA
jgi:beta-1,4-mannosyltransferase